jgi:HemY protein
LLASRLTQRICTLMARIEGEQHGHTGRVREWLARAVNAPRDPAWTADGVVSEHWAPISPVTRALDAFRWRVPVEAIDEPTGALRAAKVEALVGLGAGSEPAFGHDKGKPVVAYPAAEAIEAVDQPPPARGRPVLPASQPGAVRSSEAATVAKTLQTVPVTGVAAREAQSGPAEAHTAKAEERKERTQPRPETPSVTKTAETARGRLRKPAETKIFVPPRAPDDPGPADTDDGLEIGPFHPSGAKV